MIYRLPRTLMAESFGHLRACGRLAQECQVLWVSSWAEPGAISAVIHTNHRSHASGFDVETGWLAWLWNELASRHLGIRVQVHTHPGRAFHSPTDDRWPIIHLPGFLSLVIPNFGMQNWALQGAYLAEIDNAGRWREVTLSARIKVE